MLTIRKDFKCMLCGDKHFYISPVGKKTISGDTIHSLNEWQLICKKCGKTYILDIKITAV